MERCHGKAQGQHGEAVKARNFLRYKLEHGLQRHGFGDAIQPECFQNRIDGSVGRRQASRKKSQE